MVGSPPDGIWCAKVGQRRSTEGSGHTIKARQGAGRRGVKAEFATVPTAAVLILASPFAWFPEATPDVPVIRDWVRRTQDRPAAARTSARDEKGLAAQLQAA